MTIESMLNDRILFGAAFYDEYRRTGDLDRDLDLMAAANFSVIRVGESVWSTWEPRPGIFHLDWLAPVLDGAHERDIGVIFGTPTYAVPPWLQKLHPEIAAETATGQAVPWGWRQEINIAHPAFRRYAERVIRATVGRYASHPAVIGFQVDNEPGLYLLHNHDVFSGFLDYLQEIYGSVDELNRQWGLTYWSHRINEWDELWAPDGNHSPQYQLEWRRYQAQIVTDFISWQAGIVREYARSEQFVTTCLSYERPAVDDVAVAQHLDVTAGNPYYKMQDALRIGVEVPRDDIWYSTGVWGLYEQGDRMYSSAQSPFLVTETNAQSIGQSHWENHPPYPGQIALAAFALISRGARMIEYWQWQTLHEGIETYWGGVLPHSGRPGRVYSEVAALGGLIRDAEQDLRGYQPDAEVAFLYSNDTKRSFEFYPPLPLDNGGPDAHAYLRLFDAFYRGAFEAGAQSRVLHPGQFMASGAAELVASTPVLVAPSLYVAGDDELAALVAYARAGGHLILGIRTGYGDHLGRARTEVAPAIVGPAAGISYDEYSSLDAAIEVRGDGVTPLTGHALGWADALVTDGAETLATFEEGIYAGRPAVTTRLIGSGRITYVATLPDRKLARQLMAWAIPHPLSEQWHAPSTVVVASGRSVAGRVWFVSNWSDQPATVRVPTAVVIDGHDTPTGQLIDLPAWGQLIAIEVVRQPAASTRAPARRTP